MKHNKANHLKQNSKLKKNNASKKDTRNSKKDIKPEKSIKKTIIKFLIFIFVIALIVGICFLTIKLFNFKKLAKEMFNASPSNIFDSNNNVIAQIGIERNRKKIEFSEIPDKLVNAYVSIEDERFFKHHGVDIKRTGAAILSFVTKRWFFFWWKYNYSTISKKYNRR